MHLIAVWQGEEHGKAVSLVPPVHMRWQIRFAPSDNCSGEIVLDMCLQY